MLTHITPISSTMSDGELRRQYNGRQIEIAINTQTRRLEMMLRILDKEINEAADKELAAIKLKLWFECSADLSFLGRIVKRLNFTADLDISIDGINKLRLRGVVI